MSRIPVPNKTFLPRSESVPRALRRSVSGSQIPVATGRRVSSSPTTPPSISATASVAATIVNSTVHRRSSATTASSTNNQRRSSFRHPSATTADTVGTAQNQAPASRRLSGTAAPATTRAQNQPTSFIPRPFTANFSFTTKTQQQSSPSPAPRRTSCSPRSRLPISAGTCKNTISPVAKPRTASNPIETVSVMKEVNGGFQGRVHVNQIAVEASHSGFSAPTVAAFDESTTNDAVTICVVTNCVVTETEERAETGSTVDTMLAFESATNDAVVAEATVVANEAVDKSSVAEVGGVEQQQQRQQPASKNLEIDRSITVDTGSVPVQQTPSSPSVYGNSPLTTPKYKQTSTNSDIKDRTTTPLKKKQGTPATVRMTRASALRDAKINADNTARKARERRESSGSATACLGRGALSAAGTVTPKRNILATGRGEQSRKRTACRFTTASPRTPAKKARSAGPQRVGNAAATPPADNWDYTRLAWLLQANRAGLVTTTEYLAVLEEVMNPPPKASTTPTFSSGVKASRGFDYQSIPLEVKNVHGVKLSTGWDPRFPALKRVRKPKAAESVSVAPVTAESGDA